MDRDIAVLDAVNALTFTIDSNEGIRRMRKTNKIREATRVLIRYVADAEEIEAIEEQERGELATLKKLLSSLGPIVQQLSGLSASMEKTQLAEEIEDEDEGPDEIDEMIETETEDEDEEKNPDDDDDEEKPAMDAKEIQRMVANAVRAAMTTMKQPESKPAEKSGGMDAKELLAEIASRDKLAKSLYPHTGVFDHAEMTTADVVAYGVKKLGLRAPTGYERAYLDGYLAHQKATAKPPVPGIGTDGNKTSGMDWIDKQFAADKQ